MIATQVGSVSQWEALLATWRNLDVPEGYRAEISNGYLRLSRPQLRAEYVAAAEIHRVLASNTAPDVGVFQTAAVSIDAAESLYVPDIVAAPVASMRDDGSIQPTETLLAVEITSPANAHIDRQEKLHGYAAGAVSAYLLIDLVRSAGPTAAIHTAPVAGAYQYVIQVPLGESLRLPEPFDIDLDTSQLRTDEKDK